ncbi:MAG: peptidylprolyl isomerase [Burkholderiales bacterium]|nr:peptidylprolyl isomerase [Burkholderiales bacterium]MDP2399934.1 peptidylprolyl isomerase [Burkholderiales bacterium]
MPFRLCLVLSCAAVLAVTAPAVHAQGAKPRAIVTVDRIIAVVNDEIITQKELAARVDFALRQLRQQGTPPPPRDVIERQLLERLIGDRVQMQHARNIGMRVDDAELDKALERIATDNKLSLAQMRGTLERDGVPFEKFREDIRSEITLARLREREVAQKIVITESEIDNFIQSQQAQPGRSDEFNVSHILVSVPESASPEQLQTRRARAEEALAQIRGGADFRQIAAAFSDAPEALQGGLLGWRESERLPTLFLEALRALQAGQLTDLLRSPNGFHILRLNERRGGQAPIMVQQSRARHILIKTNELVSETEARNRMLALKERLDNKADFAELARAHSEDTSASRGGDLGWLNAGDTVPEFEQAMNALKPGQISAPVRSPFGWHIIEVLERRTQDMTRDGQRMNARQALRERKTDEAYQEWVRQLRDRAYVERRLDES